MTCTCEVCGILIFRCIARDQVIVRFTSLRNNCTEYKSIDANFTQQNKFLRVSLSNVLNYYYVI